MSSSTASRVFKNTGILYIRMAITVFISLYSTRLILGALGAEDFGIFNLVAGTIAMLTFLNTAMAAATQRFISHAEGAGEFHRTKQIFNVSIVLHFFIAIIIILLLQLASLFLFNGTLSLPAEKVGSAKFVYLCAAISMGFNILSVPDEAVINAHENMLLFAIISIIEAVLKMAIAIYLTYSASDDSLIAYGFLTALSALLIYVFRRIYCHKKYPECRINIKKYYNHVVFKEMTGFAGWSFLGAASGIISQYGQGLVLNIFFGPIVNAAQAIAMQIAGQIGAFSHVMLKALNPVIVKSYGANNRTLMLNSVLTGSKFSFILFALFSIPAILDMKNILNVWLKDVPDYAVIFCQLLLVKNLTEQMVVIIPVSIAAKGDIKAFQISL